MTARTFVLTPSAGRQLKEIWRYTRQVWSRDQAVSYTNRIKAILEHICLRPEIGRPVDRIASGLRFRKAGQHYIFYFTLATQIQIVGILHGRMDHARHLRDASTSTPTRQ